MEVRIIRTKRKTLCLNVRQGTIIVRAPLRAPEREIMQFVEKHRRWIALRLQEQENIVPLALHDGTRLTLFGREYAVQTGRSRIDGCMLFLPEKQRESELLALLKELTLDYMGTLTQRIAQNYRFSYSKIRPSVARSRWGSCSKTGCISYSVFTAFLPAELTEYVAVHELCHTRVFNHSAAFWRQVERVLPDWKERYRALRQSSRIMQLLVPSAQ